MPFRFKFAAVLKHRRHRRDTAQFELAEAQRQHQTLLLDHTRLAQHLAAHRAQLEAKQVGGISAAEHSAFCTYLRSVEQDLLKLEMKLRKAGDEVQKARARLLEREKEVELVETLDDQQRTTYILAERRREQKLLDEVAGLMDCRPNE